MLNASAEGHFGSSDLSLRTVFVVFRQCSRLALTMIKQTHIGVYSLIREAYINSSVYWPSCRSSLCFTWHRFDYEVIILPAPTPWHVSLGIHPVEYKTDTWKEDHKKHGKYMLSQGAEAGETRSGMSRATLVVQGKLFQTVMCVKIWLFETIYIFC